MCLGLQLPTLIPLPIATGSPFTLFCVMRVSWCFEGPLAVTLCASLVDKKIVDAVENFSFPNIDGWEEGTLVASTALAIVWFLLFNKNVLF